ncbi:LLM class flavin-dependent oxidoreductase [Frankia sp. AgB1.9]|uniref:LLM class flavin-dependent oxidoreductase n=1 Tax=unclassified Frankia TaxID=2632575 RepID=UPI0019329D41|nr:MULTISPECIES: LLM class flavin-dependent oxidoreductase [unclassified Frankia]MBL7486881.1 LLM class flavin-dependent oxidoreductase [Frankia sp. AgW1.1]MBL7547232.1 LLM class flavin-dependent oxidoreductase [Frankia sp. AgB1.9]MBL7623976.1 LLM class flavin-dependent oxidoreductase [Frankia sp. AgB1.8]
MSLSRTITNEVAGGTRWPLRFGIFLAPFHKAGRNPTLLLEQDLALLEHLDRLGFDEAWIGEHHSGGWEIISSPEVFIAHAAARTRRIRLGTGVVSLPYHHPLHVADRIVLLDHLTRGRTMLGVGPGQLASDAHMLGIDTNQQRAMMEESLEAIVALLAGEEPVTRQTDWFTLRDAVLQLAPFTRPRPEIAVAATFSPAGPRTAGRFGAGLLSIAASQAGGFDVLGSHWEVANQVAAQHGQTMDRRDWRLMGMMHLADTPEQAAKDLEYGLADVQNYQSKVLPISLDPSTPLRERIEQGNASGSLICGTPDLAIAQIERLWHQSGGFGAYLLLAADFANPAATQHSYELFAREVMPHFTGASAAPLASENWQFGKSTTWRDQTAAAIGKAIQDHAAATTPADAKS